MPGADRNNDKYKPKKATKSLLDEYEEPPPVSSSKSKSKSKEPEIDINNKKSSKNDDKRSSKHHSSSKNYEENDEDDKKSRHNRKKETKEDEDDDRKSRHHRKKETNDDDEDDRKSRHHRKKDSYNDEEKDEKQHKSSRHRSKYDEEEQQAEENNSSSKHRSHREKKTDEDEDYERKKERRHHRSEEKNESSSSTSRHHRSKNNDDEEDESNKKHHRKREESKPEPIKEEEAAYEEDFDDDFEEDSEAEKEPPPVKKKEETKPKHYSSDEETKKSKHNKSKRNNNRYDDDENYEPVRIVKANAHVKVPTELVQCYSSKIYFNHDSIDRQQRRAKDLLKTIELDKKSFSILDIDPTELRTAYSSHLKHEKVQTNEDVFEIEVQTDEIDYQTRWTQYPPEDSKGYGTDDKYNRGGELEDDILEKFRIEVNINDLQIFLNKASKVIETILRENNNDTSKISVENKSDIEFSQGYNRVGIPKFLSKLTKSSVLTSCCFNRDDSNYFVCSYHTQTIPDKEIRFNSTIFLVWHINELNTPYRVLMCESPSFSLCYSSFMVFSGNADGSVCVWDLREPSNLHKLNFKNKNNSETSVIRTPTYSTAGVLLNENHFSEVKSLIPLQSQSKNQEKSVFMQIATLELECKLIIWTVVELSHIDLAGFETDLGLLPGGRIKLVKSSQIDLNNLIRMPFGKAKYQTLSLTSPLNQTNHLFISTNLGSIIHILRENELSCTTTLRSEFSDGNLQVTSVCFHPEINDILLAGYGNGELRLYHMNYLLPIKTWSFACQGNRVKEIHWIPSRNSAFIVVDESANLYIWDLLADDTQFISSKKFNEFGGLSLSFLKQSTKLDEKIDNSLPFLMFNSNLKEIDIHLFTSDWSKKSEKETKKFSKFLKNLLITF